MIKNTDLWAEGKYIDLWTIPHIMAGIILAGLINLFGVHFWLNIIISTLIMIGWEFFELYALDVHEQFTNKIMDVVTGIFGFLVMYWFIVKYTIGPIFPYLAVLIVIYLLLNTWGLYAHYNKIKSNS